MPNLQSLTLHGFKSFGLKTEFKFSAPVTAIVGPNGSGKSNVAEAFRFVLGEQSLRALRGRRGEDLIWNGSSPRVAQAAVTIALDNSDRRFPIDFSELTIGREVGRDGVNFYFLNGHRVLWREIHELLLTAALPPSGYHLISQGEADRLISADVVERRALVEEALGLRLYQWKLNESEKKLARTRDNAKQVESLRRELAPHLRFLRREVEKMRQADEWRATLKRLYLDYFKAETHYWRAQAAKIRDKLTGLERRLEEAKQKLAVAPTTEGEIQVVWRAAREKLAQARAAWQVRVAELARRRGRLEAVAELEARRTAVVSGAETISRSRWEAWIEGWRLWLGRLRQVAALEALPPLLAEAEKYLAAWPASANSSDASLAVLTSAEAALRAEDEELAAKEKALEEKIETERRAWQAAETERWQVTSVCQTIEAELVLEREKSAEAAAALARLAREGEEAAALIDREVLDFESLAVIDATAGADRQAQERRWRELEKLKLRLEDLSVGGADTLKEFKDTISRDEYLATELDDLTAATTELEKVRLDLLEKIAREFKDGLQKINQAFQEFFQLMFGGGEAALILTEKPTRRRRLTDSDSGEEDVVETGIDIKLNLPRKRVRGLEMLSGGERSLVSIALLFALSQVKPPPFLVLDETDAALDESNSRKYGEVIESLSRRSQLILITHNRETMSRAGVIYGVTMNQSGCSQLLSIKFDDALSYAKA